MTIGFSRRQGLIGGLAIAASAPSLAAKRKKRNADTNLDLGPLDEIADKLLVHLRETATYNGTTGALNGGLLARQMDDYSPAGEASLRQAYTDAHDFMARIRIRGDSPAARHVGTINAILENATRSSAIPYGRINVLTFTGHSPYVVSQISGPHIDGINIMMEQQALGSPKAVDAWIEKLDAFPNSFAGVIEKIRADRAAGCIPPKILLEKTLPVLDDFLALSPADHPLMKAFASKMLSAGLSKRTRSTAIKRAILALEKSAKPALQALRDEIAALASDGRIDSGVWAQPQGDALYAANVIAQGDTQLTPDEIHRLGADEISRIAAEMNGILAGQGLTKGGIGERMAALAKDPKNLFADSDAGREALLSYVRSKVKAAEVLYPELLPASLIPHQSLVVKRVPLATQESAPGGFYDGPSLDGTRPGTYWINLRDIGAVPRFRLPTLSYHEGVPGHHTQGAIAAALGEAPLLVRIASFNAYQEGWALYAERLMAELGTYKDDPLGNLGRLQDELFRAVRLVVDTGLHHKRWTREQAIRTMQDVTGVAESRVTAEVERYMAWPGQALGYKLGQLKILDMRTQFLAKKGRSTDLRPFHRTVLDGGAMPLSLVEGRLADMA
jgi:uncharacterized protein (DUF885 family)